MNGHSKRRSTRASHPATPKAKKARTQTLNKSISNSRRKAAIKSRARRK